MSLIVDNLSAVSTDDNIYTVISIFHVEAQEVM